MKIPWKSNVEILQWPMSRGGLGDVKTHPHPLKNCDKLCQTVHPNGEDNIINHVTVEFVILFIYK